MKRTALAPLTVLATLVLGGCAGAPSASSPAPAPTTTVTRAPPETTAPLPSPSVAPNAPAGQCLNENLALSLGQPDGAAGSEYVDIIFTNTGSEPCALRGAPGVSVVGGGNGSQIGAAAEQTEPANPPTIQLAPSGTAKATLKSVNIGTDGGPLADQCTVTTGDGYRVYPPHSFDSVFVASPGVPACSNTVVWMSVTAVAAG
ncbi:DUF4232 domain-containing protein [Homoserinimonas sp. OAct 916]|uniref:DUF4232 domain-containing protein n=1 Tax=Homoserinimonas sp. OAct 916 TaxID=2211450 RepID=UPI000DBE0D50|nr:DUF4232 domain-containing protein [Homoserinimonas sp. OAct 916]